MERPVAGGFPNPLKRCLSCHGIVQHMLEGPCPMDLMELPVILIDCQTTGSTPTDSQIIEMGWTITCAMTLSCHSLPEITSTFCGLRSNHRIPRRITRITGITQDDVVSAPSPEEVWRRFYESFDMAELSESKRIMVAHHAQFEERFLGNLHRDVYPTRRFPFRFICTRMIAHHIYPYLPRRSLRAVSGLIGCNLGEYRRVEDHVRATAALWVHFVSILREKFGISDESALRILLMNKPNNQGKRYPFPRERRLALSEQPGIYRFKNAGGSVLYVGKARSLKTRINSHFTGKPARDDMRECLSQVTEIETHETISEMEASLLEVEEIAKHEPPYNRALRNEERKLRFFTREFTHFQYHPDELHVRGPFRDHKSIRVLPYVLLWLSGNRGNASVVYRIREALGIRRESYEGITDRVRSYFIENHGKPEGMADLLSIGRRYNLEMCDVSIHSHSGRRNMDNETSGVTGLADDEVFERGYNRLMSIIGLSCRLIFRSQWMSSLIDSVVAWRLSQTKDGGHLRYLVLTGGRIAESGTVDSYDVLPAYTPPRRNRLDRLSQLNRIEFNRLRTLNTELKRLIREERNPVVFRPIGRPISADDLRRVLDVT